MNPQARVGTVLDGRYRLDRLIGEGGMGTVYRAYHLPMERDVAVKVLRTNLSDDPLAAKRFALEAKATTRVESPNAVKVFDFGFTADGDMFMVMEYLDGRTAQRELDVDGPMSVDRAIAVARQALAALSAAHAVGVVHRDIKPENLLLLRVGDNPDFCKVLDFGVAKIMTSGDLGASALTKDGMVFGTPDYMSPEQACGQPLDGRSDIYSLAATLYALITGGPLFRGDSPIKVLSQHVLAEPPRLTAMPHLAHLAALDSVLTRALAKRPSDRHRDADELSRELAFLATAGSKSGPSQAAPTMPVGAIALRSRTPDSPLGVLEPVAGVGSTGATPLVSWPPPSVAQTGYSAPIALGASGALSGAIAGVSVGGLGASGASPVLSPAVAPRRRWLVAVVGGALLFGAIGGALVVSTLQRPSDPPPAGSTGVAAARDAAPPIVDTRPPPATAVDAGASSDAGAEVAAIDAAAAPDARDDKPDAEERARRVRKHLAAAQAAQREGNLIRQLTEANFALELAPRDAKALLLGADALLSSGDLKKGCKYLARAKTAGAAARAKAAGCP